MTTARHFAEAARELAGGQIFVRKCLWKIGLGANSACGAQNGKRDAMNFGNIP